VLVRITVGTEDDTKRLIAAAAEILAGVIVAISALKP
jgi:histidinol-phosphate/aromatic aminotransferase/cobyric acid decarboxylase-like protein